MRIVCIAWVAGVVAGAVTACGPVPRSRVDGAPGDAALGGDSRSGDGPQAPVTSVYAHTASALFRVDPETLSISKVGNFAWSNGSDEMTDLAIDQTGDMIGISFDSVYRVNPQTAQATRLNNRLTGNFNGLTFVPAALLNSTGVDILVASRNSDGNIFRVDANTGTTSVIGRMGGSVTSSGDIVAVAGVGVFLTANAGGSFDVLQKLTPPALVATAVGSSTGYAELWGLGFWKNKIFGFANNGDFVLIDRTTGQGQLVMNVGQPWFGAAVSTVAPVVE